MRLGLWTVRGATGYVFGSFIGLAYHFPETVNGSDIIWFGGFMVVALWTDSVFDE